MAPKKRECLEMRLLRITYFLPMPRKSKKVVGQSKAAGKMNSPLNLGVFEVCFVLCTNFLGAGSGYGIMLPK